MEKPNPYEAPQQGEPGGPAREPLIGRRGRSIVVLVKVVCLVAGLWRLVSTGTPTPNATLHRRSMLTRATGGFLLVLAAVPYRMPRGGRRDDNALEQLE